MTEKPFSNKTARRPWITSMARAKSISILLAILLAIASLPSAVAAPVGSWDPAHTWVFIVGVLHWQKKAGLDSFDAKNRRDQQLKDWFLQNGVPSDHVVCLLDKSGTLKTINDELATLLDKTRAGDFLFTYYCGHGWVEDGEAYWGNYDATDDPGHCWSVRSFTEALASGFHGSAALILADCCYSGSVGEEMSKRRCPFSYATLTSAVSSASSTQNWTFTQSILDCLRGHRYADYDHDGTIRIDELGRYAQAEMQALEDQNTSASRSKSFHDNFVVATVKFKDEPIPEIVEVLYEGEWYKAKLLERKEKQVKVHFTDIGYDDDEWVDCASVRKAATKSAPPATAKHFAIGQKVRVFSDGTQYPGVVRAYRNGQYLIHYDNYDQSEDDWREATEIKE